MNDSCESPLHTCTASDGFHAHELDSMLEVAREDNERLKDVARMALGVASYAMQEFDYRRGDDTAPNKEAYEQPYREARALFDAAWKATH